MRSISGRFGVLAMMIAALLPAAVQAAGDNSVTFGSRWWSQTSPEAAFREYLDLSRGGFLESFQVREWNADNAAVLSGQNALRQDQSTRLGLSRGVRWQLELRNDQIPHLFSRIARTPYVETAPGVFRLQDSLQARIQAVPANYTALMTDALKHSSIADLSIRTEVSSMRLRSRPAPGWRIEVNGERRDRTGYKAYGASFSTPIELPEPIRHRTLTGSAAATYERGAGKITATFGMSEFRNDVDALIFDNPRRITDVAASGDASSSQGRIDLYPNNQVVSGSLALGYRLPRRTSFAATVGVSQGKQNDDFLPFTINTAVAQRSLDSLPARSLNAKLTRVSQDYRITTRPYSRVAATLRFHTTHDDNQTPELTFIGTVRADGSFTRGALTTHPFGHTHSVGGADLSVQVADPLTVGVLVERRVRERTFREVEKDDENVVGANARAALAEDIELSANFRYGDRKLDHFNDEDYKSAGAFIEQPDLRRFDVANRKQTAGGGDVSWDLARWISVDAEFSYLLNDYADTRYGLDREEQRLVMTSATIRPRARLDVTGGYGFGQSDVRQNSNETGTAGPPTPDAATDWTVQLKDRNVFVFGDAEWWVIERRLLLNLGYEFTRALGNQEFITLLPNNELPATFYRRHDVQVGARWRIQNSTELGGRWTWEQYDVNDLLGETIPLIQFNGTSPTGQFMGDNRLDYRAHRIEVLATRRF